MRSGFHRRGADLKLKRPGKSPSCTVSARAWEVRVTAGTHGNNICQAGSLIIRMGRHSSDTEEEYRSRRKKKHRKRSSSSSSSDSRTFSRRKPGKRSRSRSRGHHSRSHSYDKRRRHRSSSSSSYGSRRKRSRSRSRDRGKSHKSQRSRSRSRTRRSRSRHHHRSCSRSSDRSSHARTHSRSHERERRKGRDKEKLKEKERDRGKEKEHSVKRGDSGIIKAGLEHLSPAEQAKVRLQMVLQAAAKADEALKAKEKSEEEAKRRKEEDQPTLVEQVKRIKEIEAIESDSFVPQAFKSSKETRKVTELSEVKHESAILGTRTANLSKSEKEIEVGSIPTAIKYQDDNSLAHPNDKFIWASNYWIEEKYISHNFRELSREPEI
ncbi:serine/Arginine-related protein 53 isoform X2 [Rhinatrema bivittatum]|uniref:serine/Arginine-related protein 53 isoform X2 n=1 Tax=Rhinatrema bivittatum TaxID=194408 RepID=UPI001126F8C5|nr:serine/Arginine-related protein 53 isoform X2 [Rhinatrema bivittatum]